MPARGVCDAKISGWSDETGSGRVSFTAYPLLYCPHIPPRYLFNCLAMSFDGLKFIDVTGLD